VIKGRVCPRGRVVAQFAGSREAGMRHRTVRVLEVRLMARNAQGAIQVVVVVDMAVRARARRHCVRAGQREASLCVIELTVGPLDGVMALLAGGREAGVRHRTLRAVVVILMACNTQRAGQVVIVVDVAIRASSWRHGV